MDTPGGQYRVVNALPADEMRRDRNPTADHSHALRGVSCVQYFTEAGDAIHGSHWQHMFGTQESQGCINLMIADGAYLFNQTGVSTPLVILD